MSITNEVAYEMTGGGAARYEPVRADPCKGFGPAEVHPERVPIEKDGKVTLEFNGHWRVDFAPGTSPMSFFVFKDTRNGQPFNAKNAAEQLAALRNEGLPTRVVDYDGTESTSKHTAESVQAQLDASAAIVKAAT